MTLQGDRCRADCTMTATAGSPADSHFETGSLTKRAPEQSEFVGSSSGVHFIKLVRAVCADRLATDNPDASSSLRVGDVLEGDDDDSDATDRYQNPNSPTSHPPRMTETISNNYLATLDMHSSMPSYMEARAMVVQYFELWHPLLPFLYGPGFMRDFDNLYLGAQSSPQHRPIVAQSRAGCYKFLLCCMFAVMDPKRQIISTSDTLAIVGQLASHNNLLTIQAILMAQLRCVSSMALRTASSHSGLLSRLLLHAGLHRCPFRYEQLDTDSKDMRKRVFWSAYILDRYLSQALGLPPTIADSDVDVCAPGCEELHSPAKSATPASIAKTSRLSRSRSSHASEARNELSTPRAAQVYGIDAARLQEDSPPSPDRNEFLLAHLVTHARLVSQVLELFHKSIHVRSLETDSVLKIRAEANKWFNSLPPWPPGPEEPLRDHLDRVIKPEHAKFVPFLHVLYQQLLIAIHRPYLSLPKTTAEYGNSIQLVIRAARHTITILSLVDEMFWPGYLASAWMSGLVIIFACQTQAYSIDQGTRYVACATG